MDRKTELIIKQTAQTCAVQTVKILKIEFPSIKDASEQISKVANSYYAWICLEQDDQFRIIRQSQLKSAIELIPAVKVDEKFKISAKTIKELATLLVENITNSQPKTDG